MSNNVPNDPGKRMEKIVSEGKGEEVYSRLPNAVGSKVLLKFLDRFHLSQRHHPSPKKHRTVT